MAREVWDRPNGAFPWSSLLAEGGVSVSDRFEALSGGGSNGGVRGVGPTTGFLGGFSEEDVELVEEMGGDVESKGDDVESFWILGPPLVFETFPVWPSNPCFEHGEWSTFG